MNDYYNEKIEWLESNYSEFSPTEYYRMMFPNGSFQKPKESNGDYKPNGILQFRCKGEEKGKMHSRIINDDHKTIDDCLKGNVQDLTVMKRKTIGFGVRTRKLEKSRNVQSGKCYC